jgi:hypothetical protein
LSKGRKWRRVKLCSTISTWDNNDHDVERLDIITDPLRGDIVFTSSLVVWTFLQSPFFLESFKGAIMEERRLKKYSDKQRTCEDNIASKRVCYYVTLHPFPSVIIGKPNPTWFIKTPIIEPNSIHQFTLCVQSLVYCSAASLSTSSWLISSRIGIIPSVIPLISIGLTYAASFCLSK